MKVAAAVPFPPLTLDPSDGVPLHKQLYSGLRHAILAGQLGARQQIPSTRTLAAGLGVSRTTVLTAFDQLLAEGYLEGVVGSGTYVASELPESFLQAKADKKILPGTARSGRLLSSRGKRLAVERVTASRDIGRPVPFRDGIPALDLFPAYIWARITARFWRQPPRDLLGYNDPAGYGPLREQIAAYLRTSRAVHCASEQVIVVSGSQQALYLCARLLLDPGDAVWIEDPAYLGARAALLSAGARLVPVPVDRDGLNVTAGIGMDSKARLAYVTPSHQYPLGVTMSLARRMALLEWAGRTSAWVIEDDYDSEYRYVGRPLASLQALDSGGRVIYLGTFSKVLFPGLRLGYIVVPSTLIEAFHQARALIDRGSSIVEQALVASFMSEGHFARHIRRMRAAYAERQKALVSAARRHLAGLIDVKPAPAGMHLVGWLREGLSDIRAARIAVRAGVEAQAISAYRIAAAVPSALILGYTAFDPERIERGVKKLAAAFQRIDPTPPAQAL